MAIEEIISEASEEERFVLGSSQYYGIYTSYKNWCLSDETKEVDKEIVSMEFFLIDSLKDLHEQIVNEAEQWKETPDLKEWISLELKVKLLHLKDNDTGAITKRAFADLFELLKNKSWDLWCALDKCVQLYPDLLDYLKKAKASVEPTYNRDLGLIIYFFSQKMDLNDKEVREIFGGFDT